MNPALALPNRRVEEWKYSDLARALGDAGFGDASAGVQMRVLPACVEAIELDQPVRPLWVSAHYGKLKTNAVSALSLAKAASGLALRVPKGQVVAAPLRLTVTGEGHTRLLLVLEEGASLTLLEEGDAAGTRNAGFEIVLGANAELHHVRLAPVSVAVQVEEISVRLAGDARYYGHFANFGAKLSRTELAIALEGEGSEAHLSGVSVLSGNAHADVTTYVTHAVGHTQSTQLFKKVVGGHGQAVYQGKVTVAKGADGADSRQTAKALLLGERAEADLKPELEILADDVKCAHGAAVGDLDADSLFYLRTRGISEQEARHLLIHAFLEDALSDIAHNELRETVRGAVSRALNEVAA
ncbi:MAG TPA: Fe-S cluster assembly protein SufD [Rhizomicrobium sp.]|jgi:Fe-S cluster assembly protein SufD|nr:Fe-S cluster assembly protein SufD [Rhizomicrobium sp.]